MAIHKLNRQSWRYTALLAPFGEVGMSRFVLIFLGLIPVPLGANRPLAWIVSAGCLGLAGMLYSLWLSARPNTTPALGSLRPVAWLYVVHILALVFQLLPIGPFAPIADLPASLSPMQVSLAPGATALMILRSLSYAMLFAIVFALARDRLRGRRMLYVMLGIISTHAVAALVMFRMGDTLLGIDKWAYLGVVTGTFVNRNSFATFMAFGLVLGVCLLLDATFELRRNRIRGNFEDRNWFRPVLVTLALFPILAALLGTQSRMGAAAGVLGVAAALAVTALRQKRLEPRAVLAGGGIAILLATLAVLNVQGIMTRLMIVEQSWATRQMLYSQVLGLIGMRPLTGIGGGAFEIVFPAMRSAELGSDVVWDKAHNSYLTLWSELGVLAGSALPLTVAVAAAFLVRKLFRSRVFVVQVTAAMGVVVVAAVHSLVDFSLEIQAVAYWFVAILAIGLAGLGPPGRHTLDRDKGR